MTTDTTAHTPEQPKGVLSTLVQAMPADTNQWGDIFGGWLLSHMDVAGGIYCLSIAHGRVATIAIDSMEFHEKVDVGDVLYCYVDLMKVGRSSVTVLIQAWVHRGGHPDRSEKVTEGHFTYVAVDSNGRPRPIPKDTVAV
ncbi:MAG: acyl-CoA thioesterase [Magnetospiraceae bacterium]